MQGYAQVATGYGAAQPMQPPAVGGAQAPGQPSYPQGFQQGYAQYGDQQPNYPKGFQPIFGGYNPAQGQREPSAFVTAVTRLPGMFKDAFRDPGAVLQGMMERHDVYTLPVVSAAALLLAFLGGITATRGLVMMLVGFVETATGVGAGLASADGVNRIAGIVSLSFGGIAALCQLLAMGIPLAVTLVYLCVMRKVRFSFGLLAALLTVLTMPTLPAALLTLLTSLFSPVVPLLFMSAGMAASYVFMGSLTAKVTGRTDVGPVSARLVIILVSMLLTFFFIALMLGLTSGGLFRIMMVQIQGR
jgi:hypothetical protein